MGGFLRILIIGAIIYIVVRWLFRILSPFIIRYFTKSLQNNGNINSNRNPQKKRFGAQDGDYVDYEDVK